MILVTIPLIGSLSTTVRAAGARHAAVLTISNVRISHDTFLAHSEPDVAINPTNPRNLVAGSKFFTNPAKYQFKIGTYFSTDAGRTWIDSGLLPGFEEFYRTSDISFAYSPNGSIVYACVLAEDSAGVRNGIYVSRSKDGGKSWSPPTTVFEDLTGSTFSDKPWIAVDTSKGSRRGAVYVAWNLDAAGAAGDPDNTQARSRLKSKQVADSQPVGEVVSRSVDYGKSFSAPVVVRRFTPQNGNFALGAMPAVGPNGHVYLAYLAYDEVTIRGRTGAMNRMIVAESADGARTFSFHVAVGSVTALPDRLPNGTFRNYSMPSFKVSPRDGSMVVAWADLRNHDSDILSVRSTTGGRTWSKPIRVNHDPIHNGIDQMQPALAVAPNGTFTCAWFDRRYSPGNRLIDEAIAQSDNGGTSFGTNLRVTKNSWDPAIGAPHSSATDTFIGDYQGLAVDNLHVYPLWNDTQNGSSQEIRTAAIAVTAFARRH